MAVKFIIANSPSSRLCWITPLERHQQFHLLSYFHLNENLNPHNALRTYKKRESEPTAHGKSFRQKVHSPPVRQRITYDYYPNFLIREKGLPPARMSLRDAVIRCLKKAGADGWTAKRLARELVEKKNITVRLEKLAAVMTAYRHQVGSRIVDGKRRYFLAKYRTKEEKLERDKRLKGKRIYRKDDESAVRIR